MAVRFSVEMVFDLPQRAGLLASGKVLEGVISKGTVLQDETTGARTTVIGVEFGTPADRQTGRVTLLLARTVPTPVVEGRVLTNAT